MFPVVVMFVLGLWFTGWTLNCGGEVRHAVELGSRIYLANPSASDSDLRSAVSAQLVSVDISSVTLTTSNSTIGSAAAKRVTWSYQASAPIPFMTSAPYSFSGWVEVPAATS